MSTNVIPLHVSHRHKPYISDFVVLHVSIAVLEVAWILGLVFYTSSYFISNVCKFYFNDRLVGILQSIGNFSFTAEPDVCITITISSFRLLVLCCSPQKNYDFQMQMLSIWWC
jgi:hypothetical protein